MDTPGKEIREVEGLEVHCGIGGGRLQGRKGIRPRERLQALQA